MASLEKKSNRASIPRGSANSKRGGCSVNTLFLHSREEWEKETIHFLACVLPDSSTNGDMTKLTEAIVDTIHAVWEGESLPVFEKWELLKDLNKLKRESRPETPPNKDKE
jgi:hypothetical protein